MTWICDNCSREFDDAIQDWGLYGLPAACHWCAHPQLIAQYLLEQLDYTGNSVIIIDGVNTPKGVNSNNWTELCGIWEGLLKETRKDIRVMNDTISFTISKI